MPPLLPGMFELSLQGNWQTLGMEQRRFKIWSEGEKERPEVDNFGQQVSISSALYAALSTKDWSPLSSLPLFIYLFVCESLCVL